MILPISINTLFQYRPFTNRILIVTTCLISLAAIFSNDDWIYGWILDGWKLSGIFGHLFIHADFFHLFGNIVYLWVFGNAICGNTNNRLYLLLYLGFGLFAAATHNIMDGSPAIGASGAVNGIVGMATALYPKNSVNLFYFLLYRTGTFELPLWVLSLFWVAMDLVRISIGNSEVAAWAHIGGFFMGLALGILFLKAGIVKLTEWDNESLLDSLSPK
ncbi:rhomboid family intramembrane serine protease [Puniceicoccaceae bacterium K14]|nr:rhomboid family intramembrane serine protease [Puniceicoccaceae bacterium K14]